MKIPFRFNLKQKKAEQQAAQAPPPASVPTTAAKAEPKQTEVLVGWLQSFSLFVDDSLFVLDFT